MLPQLLPEETSGGISLPDSPSLSPGLFCHLPSKLHFPWMPYAVATPSTDLVGIYLVPAPSSVESAFSSTRGKERKVQGYFFLNTWEKKNITKLSFLF